MRHTFVKAFQPWGAQGKGVKVLHLLSEDSASVLVVLRTLEQQARGLDPRSAVAGIWQDWADLLRPVADEQRQAILELESA